MYFSLGDKMDTYMATEELDSLMESLAHLGASTPSKNKVINLLLHLIALHLKQKYILFCNKFTRY